MRALHRIQQGLDSLRARMGPEEWAAIDGHLSGPERELFGRMEPADQRHSILVLRTLLGLGVRDQDLLKAALLHDVGKSRCRITVLHRAIAVLVVAVFGKLPDFPSGGPRGDFWVPFYVLVNHPRIGASMLARTGSPERLWRLVELHQLEPHVIGKIPDGDWMRQALATLRLADNHN